MPQPSPSVVSRPGGASARTALVAGAAGGIGAVIVQVLWAQGCHVTATDAHAGGSVLGLDVTGPGAVEAFISDVERMHPVEVFVDAAGVFHTVDGGASMIR